MKISRSIRATESILTGTLIVLLSCSSLLVAQKKAVFDVKSPDGVISVKVEETAENLVATTYQELSDILGAAPSGAGSPVN